MPVYILKEQMPYEELLDWYEYFDRRPAEWRADNRAAKLCQVQGVKEDVTRLFPSLKPIYDPDDKFTQNRLISSFKGSWFAQMARTAVGGDKVDL